MLPILGLYRGRRTRTLRDQRWSLTPLSVVSIVVASSSLTTAALVCSFERLLDGQIRVASATGSPRSMSQGDMWATVAQRRVPAAHATPRAWVVAPRGLRLRAPSPSRVRKGSRAGAGGGPCVPARRGRDEGETRAPGWPRRTDRGRAPLTAGATGAMGHPVSPCRARTMTHCISRAPEAQLGASGPPLPGSNQWQLQRPEWSFARANRSLPEAECHHERTQTQRERERERESKLLSSK